jgi:hypothetical protein
MIASSVWSSNVSNTSDSVFFNKKFSRIKCTHSNKQKAQELFSVPYDAATTNGAGLQHLAVSAPTTSPRINAALPNEFLSSILTHRSKQTVDADSLLKAIRCGVGQTKGGHVGSYGSPAGIGHWSFERRSELCSSGWSMPASRRTSASGDDDDVSSHLQSLSLAGERPNRVSPAPTPVTAPIIARSPGRYGEDE